MPPKPEGSGTSVQLQEAVAQPNLAQIPINIPLPSKLELTGDLATNWKKFHRAWNHYEIAARLKDPENPAVNKSLRTSTLLTCIGSDTLDVYEGLEFENEDDKKDIDIVQFCHGQGKVRKKQKFFKVREFCKESGKISVLAKASEKSESFVFRFGEVYEDIYVRKIKADQNSFLYFLEPFRTRCDFSSLELYRFKCLRYLFKVPLHCSFHCV